MAAAASLANVISNYYDQIRDLEKEQKKLDKDTDQVLDAVERFASLTSEQYEGYLARIHKNGKQLQALIERAVQLNHLAHRVSKYVYGWNKQSDSSFTKSL